MKGKIKKSVYDVLRGKIEESISRDRAGEAFDLNATVRRLRQSLKLTGVELCKRAGDLDPKTLTALERGRIKNPSIRTLRSVARGLNVTVSDLFRQTEMSLDRHFYLGSQKGFCQLDFPSWGLKVVSFTPLIQDFFCGKWILTARRRFEETLLERPLPIFVSTLIGRFEVTVEGKTFSLKEGENLFFNGMLKHSFHNPLHRESVLFIVTAPSFL